MASPESIINGRFKFLDRPAALPGKCACCGSVERPVVDFNFDLDFYGAVYLCTDCLGEAASIAGILNDPSKTQVTPPNIDYEGLNEFFRSARNALDRVDLIIPEHIYRPLRDAEDSQLLDGVDEGTIPSPSGSDNSLTEPAVVKGPNDGSSLSSSLKF